MHHRDGIDALLRGILEPLTASWYADYKLYTAVFVVSCVLAQSCFASKFGPNRRVAFKCFEIVGIDLLFLHFMQYHRRELGLALCYVSSCLYLLYWTFKGYRKSTDGKRTSFVGINVYLDLKGTPFGRVLLMFLGQMLLANFLVNSTARLNMGDISYTYWFGGILSVQMTAIFGRGSESLAGSPFKAGTWAFLLRNGASLKLRLSGEEESFTPSPFSIGMRFVMDFLVNGVVRDGIAYTVPLLLMASENDLEFLQNALAILFIPTLDDKAEGGQYEVQREESADLPHPQV